MSFFNEFDTRDVFQKSLNAAVLTSKKQGKTIL